jgi:Tol biopolymer transport system component
MRGRLLAALLTLAAATPTDAGAQGAVAFTSARCDQGGVGGGGSEQYGVCVPGVFVVDDDGTDLRRVTTGGTPGEEHRSGDFGPSWSHDGARVVFARQTTESHGLIRLFTVGADGSGLQRLLPSSPFDDERDPSWSPKGGLIAFNGRDPDRPTIPALYVVAADGTGLRSITPAGWDVQAPTFMPDGSGIAFLGARPIPGQFALTEYSVWLTNAQGSRPLRLTAGDIPIASNGVSFSPSGKYLAVTLYDGSLYTVRTDGGELTRLTRNYGLDPDWAATGDAIFYRSGSGATQTVIKRLGFPRVAAPMSISAPGVADSSPDWALPGQATAAAPADRSAPLAILGDALAQPPSDVSAKVAAAQFPGPALSKIPFLVMDRSGIRRIEASAGLRVKGGCRFLESSRKLGRRRSCSRPTYVSVRDGAGWKKQTAKLPRGKYEVRLRTVDVLGNAVAKPKRRVVRVR